MAMKVILFAIAFIVSQQEIRTIAAGFETLRIIDSKKFQSPKYGVVYTCVTDSKDTLKVAEYKSSEEHILYIYAKTGKITLINE